MKTFVQIVLFVTIGCESFGQGAVRFANAPNAPVIDRATGERVPSGNVFSAALYGWGSHLPVPGDPGVMLGPSVGFLQPGFFDGGVRTNPNVVPAGGPGYFEVRVWETAHGGTFEDALAAVRSGTPVRLGRSGILLLDTALPGETPPTFGEIGASPIYVELNHQQSGIRSAIADSDGFPVVTVSAPNGTPVFLLRTWELLSLNWLEWEMIDAFVIQNSSHRFTDLGFPSSGGTTVFYQAVEVPLATNLSATPFTGVGEPFVELSWESPPLRPDHYRLERATAESNGSFEILDFIDGSQTTYADFDICVGTTNQYRLISTFSVLDVEISSRPSVSVQAEFPLQPPSDLTVVRLPDWTLQLAWRSPLIPDEFIIERSSDGSAFEEVARTESGMETNYVDYEEVEGVEFCYRVRSANYCGAQSAPSGQACANFIIAPPTAVSVERQSDCTLLVRWTPPAIPVEEFLIERSINGGEYEQLFASIEGTQTSFIDDDSAIADGAEFCYRLRSITPRRESSSSSHACITLPLRAPEAVAITRTDDCTLRVQWTAEACAEFVIERSVNGGPFTWVDTIAETNFDDWEAIIGATYFYRVRTMSEYGESAPSDPPAGYNFWLNPPLNVTATILNETDVRIQWISSGPCIDGYEIYATDCGRTYLVTSVGPEATEYIDQYAPAPEGSTVTYTVRAYSSAADSSSPESNPATVAFPVPAPSDLIADNTEQNRIVLYWNDNSVQTDQILISRAIGSGPFEHYATVTDLSTPYFMDRSIKVGAVLRYQVRASVDCGLSSTLSSPSPEVSILAPPVLQSPPNDPDWSNRIPRPVTLNWSDVTGATGGYRLIVEYWPSSGGSPQQVVNRIVPASTYTPSSTEVLPGRRYSWRVRALRNVSPPLNSPFTEDRYFVTRPE